MTGGFDVSAMAMAGDMAMMLLAWPIAIDVMPNGWRYK